MNRTRIVLLFAGAGLLGTSAVVAQTVLPRPRPTVQPPRPKLIVPQPGPTFVQPQPKYGPPKPGPAVVQPKPRTISPQPNPIQPVLPHPRPVLKPPPTSNTILLVPPPPMVVLPGFVAETETKPDMVFVPPPRFVFLPPAVDPKPLPPKTKKDMLGKHPVTSTSTLALEGVKSKFGHRLYIDSEVVAVSPDGFQIAGAGTKSATTPVVRVEIHFAPREKHALVDCQVWSTEEKGGTYLKVKAARKASTTHLKRYREVKVLPVLLERRNSTRKEVQTVSIQSTKGAFGLKRCTVTMSK